MKRTYQPKKRKRARAHGFRGRMRTKAGRAMLKRKRAKGRARLTPRRGRHGAAPSRPPGPAPKLSRSAEFDRVFREGRSFATRHLVLHAFPRPAAEEPGASAPVPRLGVSVGRRVGGAVERNRVKRLLREAFWVVAPSLPADHDFVLVARSEAASSRRREASRRSSRRCESWRARAD